MKWKFSQSTDRLRMTLPLLLAGLILSPLVGQAADSSTNFIGIITVPPVVDATNFYNSATWIISTSLPYKTSHTLNYTNVGSMTGSVGWEFDYGPLPLGGRAWSANFVNNSSSATIQANDGTIYNPPGSFLNPYLASYLIISATNIINKGILQADANGQLTINGGTVTLTRSQLMIASPSQGGGGVSGTNFTLDTGLYGETWAQSNVVMDTASRWDGTNVFVPTSGFQVQDNCGTNLYPPEADVEFPWPANELSFTPNRVAWTNTVFLANVAYTNSSGSPANTTLPTNEFRQAVFVQVGDPNITGQIRFTPSSSPTNYLQTLVVQLSAPLTNVFSSSLQTNSIYLADTLGSETNRGFFINTNPVSSFYICTGNRLQPANYYVSRSDPLLPQTTLHAFASGTPGVGPPLTNNFFYRPGFVSSTVSNDFSAYSVFVDDLAASPVGTADTNLPGRIRINADNLDLTRTWLGAQGDISIQASNLVSSAGAIVDCQNLSFDLGSTNGILNFTNLAKPDVSRLRGTLYAWSGFWTNQLVTSIPDYDTNKQPLAPIVVSNQVVFSVLLVNAGGLSAAGQLSSQVPVTVQNLALRSTNSAAANSRGSIVIGDSLTVDQTLLLDCQSLTLLGNLSLGYPLQDWVGANAPNLLFFTNDGSLNIPNNAHFGDDTAVPYTEFVNNGVILADALTLRSLDLQINSGYIVTFNSGFYATVQSAELSDADIYSGGDIQFYGNTLSLENFYLDSFNGALDFTVTNSLSDNGAANTFYCYNGFNLLIKPPTGDLLGTTINSVASGNNAEVDSVWAGQDRGTNRVGYTNNVAVGTLALIAQNYLPQATPLFVFSGTTGSNAMYVMTLDLSQLTTNPSDLANMIQINPGMKIYFSVVILGFNPPGGQTPQQYLQSQFPGQFIKIPDIPVAQSGSVDWNATDQVIDGFGASSAFQYWWTPTEAALFFSTNNGIVYTDKLGNTTTNNGIGLSLLRTDIPPAGSTSSGDTPPFPNELSLMQMVATNYPYVRIWGTPWTPAAGFKSTNDIYYGHSTTNLLNGGSFIGTTANYQAYAGQLANYVLQMNLFGINLYAISVQNEPDADVTSYLACQWTNTNIHDFIPYLYTELSNLGLGPTTPKIIIPESQNWPDYRNLAGPTLADPNVLADVGIIADHNYDSIPITLAKNTHGTNLWETEVATFDNFNGSIANGMYWANRIHQFMTVAQVNAWHYWWLVSYGSDNQGLTEGGSDTNSQMYPVLAKRMFVVGQFSRFVRPGYFRVGASAGGSYLLVSAYKDTNSQNFAIVAINTNINVDVTETFTLNNFNGSSVTPWMTSSSNSLAQMSAVPVNNSSFTYYIPPQSVVTFVGHATSTGSIAPTLALVANQTINAGQTLLVTNMATDPNVPPQTLTFTLLTAPTGAGLSSLNATNSLLTWRAPVGLAGTTNAVTVKVTDNGTLLSATNSFNIIVNPLSSLPMVSSINSTGGQVTLMVNGPQGPDYTVLTSTNLATPLASWQVLLTTNSPVTPVTLVVTNFNNATRFYRIQIGP